MQFGMDQDVPPCEFTFMSPFCNEKFSLYVPAKCYKPFVSLEYHNWWKKLKVDDSDKLDVVMIAKQYCEEGKLASIGSIESGSKRKSSSNEENNSSIVVFEAKRLKKNEQSFKCGFNNDDDVGKGKKQDGVGSYGSPLDVEDYACTILGASSSHPISI